tara:strand:+ start:2281 stop:2574 length:294 start_codon:yes stop_codon:yes gene_type:complete
MKEIGDVVGWVVGALFAIVSINYRMDKKRDEDKFKSIDDKQKQLSERMASTEATIAGIQTHYIQTLEDIKNQNNMIASEITEIKVALASIPKRKEDN